MKRVRPMLILVAVLALTGCDNPAEQSVSRLFKPSPDEDVTTSATYNFAPFAGTIWKTKVKTAIAEVKRYTGATDTKLLAPLHFDPADPKYTPIRDLKIIAKAPIGTRLRITRLMKDRGAGGNVEVEAAIQDGSNPERLVYLDWDLLSNPRGSGSNLTWYANPEKLEKP